MFSGLTCIVFSDTGIPDSRPRNRICPDSRGSEARHGQRQLHRRVQARDRRLRDLHRKAGHRGGQGARAQRQDGQRLGAEAQEVEGSAPGPKAEVCELREAEKRIRGLEIKNGFLKKPRPSSPKGKGCRHLPPDAAEKAGYPVKMVARLPEVSRPGFCPWLAAGAPTDGWGHVRDAVECVWLGGGRRHEARMAHASLPPEPGPVTLHRVRRCMREPGIRGVTPNAEKRTTIPDGGAPPKPDLAARDFTGPVPTYRLAGDITYLHTGQGWLSLATVVDLNTRMVVGWACVRAHGRRHSRLGPRAGPQARLRGRGDHLPQRPQQPAHLGAAASWAREDDVGPSCGGTGSRHGNAVAESFFATLKSEMYHHRSPATREEARLAVIGFIESSTTAGAPTRQSATGCRPT